jgi:hypothetical protein
MVVGGAATDAAVINHKPTPAHIPTFMLHPAITVLHLTGLQSIQYESTIACRLIVSNRSGDHKPRSTNGEDGFGQRKVSQSSWMSSLLRFFFGTV